MNLNLKKKEQILNSNDFFNFVDDNIKKLIAGCKTANSEDTIASEFEIRLRECLKYFNVDYLPTKQQLVKNTVIGSIKSKRLDSRFQNIVTEYKKNITDKSLEKDTDQLINYITTIVKNEKQSISSYIGILTDGKKIRFCSFSDDINTSTILYDLNREKYLEVIKIYLSLEFKNLSATNLLKDFSIDSEKSPSGSIAINLYKKLQNPNDRTFMLHSEWERLFRLAGNNDNNLKKIKDRKAILLKHLKIKSNELSDAKALFALQTTYTIIVKLVAYKVVNSIFFKKEKISFADLLTLNKKDLQKKIENIENGDIFRDIGFSNLLEGDFFSWYSNEDNWDDEIYELIKQCIEILTEYEANKLIFDQENIHDIFIEIYQSIIPKEVRHSLGEYYTPGWLAEHVINNITISNQNWSALDPCSGSGTFVLKLINKIINTSKKEGQELLLDILNRVKAIDINPVAVLTCRINYFICISSLLNNEDHNLEIPVFLGDSAYVPKEETIDNIKVISYSISTKKGKIDFALPKSFLRNDKKLGELSIDLEEAIINKDKNQAYKLIINLIKEDELTNKIKDKIYSFVNNLIYLEINNWNRIWVRIIVSFLKIFNLGKFDFIVGNPPWIDWKALPDGYRNNLKQLCLEKHIFSGDNFTGGINLNICALISSVASNNWLKQEGIFAFLMPKSLCFQQSYSGFRDLKQDDGVDLKYLKIIDWSESGNPFYPVTEKFLTYYFVKSKLKQNLKVPVIKIKLKKGHSIKGKNNSLNIIERSFERKEINGFINTGSYNHFTFVENKKLIPIMRAISGNPDYKGRVGLGLYPKELLLFQLIGKRGKNLILKNYQGKITERKAYQKKILLEDTFMHPVIEGPNIKSFELSNVKYFSALPYTTKDLKKPIPLDELKKISPKLAKYYLANKNLLVKTSYNQKVQGKSGEFYSLTRVGPYTFAPHRVAYRNNTSWDACVISKEYLLLDHACSISQDNEGNYLKEDEAHYICAVLNSKIVKNYMENSSDLRSIKTDLIIKLLKYNPKNWIHHRLSLVSKILHLNKKYLNMYNNFLNYLISRYVSECISKNKKNFFDVNLEKDLGKFIHKNEIKILTKYKFKNF
jgi:hypothetical protein